MAARCADVLSEGVVAYSLMTGEASIYEATVGRDGEADWDLLSIGVWCVVNFLMEPDPALNS